MAGSSPSSAAPRTDVVLQGTGWVLLGIAVVLLPWTIVLGVTLPATVPARHWAEAWIGFDVMETAGLAFTGWLVLRRDLRVRMVASATAAFLVADAWFDMTTAQPRWDLLQAALLAFLVEIPVAALCCAIALSAPRWCRDPRQYG